MKYRISSAALSIIFLLVWLIFSGTGWFKAGQSSPESESAWYQTHDLTNTMALGHDVFESLPTMENELSSDEAQQRLDRPLPEMQENSPVLWLDEALLISRKKHRQRTLLSGQVLRQTPEISPAQRSKPTPIPVSTHNLPSVAVTPEISRPAVVVPQTTDFFGIDPAIPYQWVFPLLVDTHTPVQGLFGASRGRSRAHAGIDLYAPHGTAVYAMTSGTVRSVYLFYENLLAIEVENDDGTMIRYTELDPLVKAGDRVEQGQLLASLRRNSSGSCMLHLEIYATNQNKPLTQTDNINHYLFVTTESRSYMRRSDLVDPSAVYTLPKYEAAE